MRIGTWNLAGRWTADHLDFVLRLDCEVLLLTEVGERLEAGSQGGRQHIAELVAVSDDVTASGARRVSALTGVGQLSDHDAYVVVVDL